MSPARAWQASIVREEGLGALWKGALPRACWTAPLGAMNFAGAPALHAALHVLWATSHLVSHLEAGILSSI